MNKEDLLFYHSKLVLDLARKLCPRQWDKVGYRTRSKYIDLALVTVQSWLRERLIKLG